VEEGTSASWDGIGLLICAHIILRLQMVTHKRAVPALDQFFSAALDYIWPSFDRAMSANAYSLKGCETMPTDLMPHYVRFFDEIINVIVFGNRNLVKLLQITDHSSICRA